MKRTRFERPDPTTKRSDVLPPPSAKRGSKFDILDKALAVCASSANPDDYEELERIFALVKSRIKSE